MKNILPRLACIATSMMLIIEGCQSRQEVSGGRAQPDENVRSFKLNNEAIADLIINRAALQRDERVILVAKPGVFDSLTILLQTKLAEKAKFLGVFSVTAETPDAWQTPFTKNAPLNARSPLSQYFMSVDLGVMLPGTDTAHIVYAAMQDVLRRRHGRTIHFHWAGAYRMNGTLLARTQAIDECYQTALLETDYQALHRIQSQFENAARKEPVRVTTPLGTDIQFVIGDRPVTKQDGDASQARSERAENLIDREIELPAGAVRVAPIETSVEGKIAFPSMVWEGVTVNGLVMEFKKGRVTTIHATEGLSIVEEALRRAGPGAVSFRELAVGFNPWLAVPDVGPQWIPYYGYGAGVIRLSLGDNTELGGKVRGGYVRWNFFTDATLQIGKEVWVKDGRLKK